MTANTGEESPDRPEDHERGPASGVRQRAEGLKVTAQGLPDRWPPARFLLDLWNHYVGRNGPALAGYVAFRMFSWLLPLMLVVVALAGLAADTGADVAGEAERSVGLGTEIAQILQESIAQTESSRVQLAVVALSGLLLGTSGLVSALYVAHAAMWGTPDRRVQGRGRLLSRVLGGAPIVVLLILASSGLRRAGFVGGVAGATMTGVVAFAMLLGLGWILPRPRTTVRYLLPGAVVGAVAMIGVQAFTAWYLVDRLGRMASTYGVFGIVLTLFLYLLLVGQIVVGAVALDAVVYQRRTAAGAPPAED